MIDIGKGDGGHDSSGRGIQGDRNSVGSGGWSDQSPDLQSRRQVRIDARPDECHGLVGVSGRGDAFVVALNRHGHNQQPVGTAADRVVQGDRTRGGLTRACGIDRDGLGPRVTASNRSDQQRANQHRKVECLRKTPAIRYRSDPNHSRRGSNRADQNGWH